MIKETILRNASNKALNNRLKSNIRQARFYVEEIREIMIEQSKRANIEEIHLKEKHIINNTFLEIDNALKEIK